MTLRPPRNAAALLALRAGDERPAQVTVSLIGSLPPEFGRDWWPVVYADPGRAYDWRCCTALAVVILVAPGVDAGAALRGLWGVCRLYPMLVDVSDARLCAVVTSLDPPRLLRQTLNGRPWADVMREPAPRLVRAA